MASRSSSGSSLAGAYSPLAKSKFRYDQRTPQSQSVGESDDYVKSRVDGTDEGCSGMHTPHSLDRSRDVVYLENLHRELLVDNLRLWECVNIIRCNPRLQASQVLRQLYGQQDEEFFRNYPVYARFRQSGHGALSSCEEGGGRRYPDKYVEYLKVHNNGLMRENTRLMLCLDILNHEPNKSADEVLCHSFGMDDDTLVRQYPSAVRGNRLRATLARLKDEEKKRHRSRSLPGYLQSPPFRPLHFPDPSCMGGPSCSNNNEFTPPRASGRNGRRSSQCGHPDDPYDNENACADSIRDHEMKSDSSGSRRSKRQSFDPVYNPTQPPPKEKPSRASSPTRRRLVLPSNGSREGSTSSRTRRSKASPYDDNKGEGSSSRRRRQKRDNSNSRNRDRSRDEVPYMIAHYPYNWAAANNSAVKDQEPKIFCSHCHVYRPADCFVTDDKGRGKQRKELPVEPNQQCKTPSCSLQSRNAKHWKEEPVISYSRSPAPTIRCTRSAKVSRNNSDVSKEVFFDVDRCGSSMPDLRRCRARIYRPGSMAQKIYTGNTKSQLLSAAMRASARQNHSPRKLPADKRGEACQRRCPHQMQRVCLAQGILEGNEEKKRSSGKSVTFETGCQHRGKIEPSPRGSRPRSLSAEQPRRHPSPSYSSLPSKQCYYDQYSEDSLEDESLPTPTRVSQFKGSGFRKHSPTCKRERSPLPHVQQQRGNRQKGRKGDSPLRPGEFQHHMKHIWPHKVDSERGGSTGYFSDSPGPHRQAHQQRRTIPVDLNATKKDKLIFHYSRDMDRNANVEEDYSNQQEIHAISEVGGANKTRHIPCDREMTFLQHLMTLPDDSSESLPPYHRQLNRCQHHYNHRRSFSAPPTSPASFEVESEASASLESFTSESFLPAWESKSWDPEATHRQAEMRAYEPSRRTPEPAKIPDCMDGLKQDTPEPFFPSRELRNWEAAHHLEARGIELRRCTPEPVKIPDSMDSLKRNTDTLKEEMRKCRQGRERRNSVNKNKEKDSLFVAYDNLGTPLCLAPSANERLKSQNKNTNSNKFRGLKKDNSIRIRLSPGWKRDHGLADHPVPKTTKLAENIGQTSEELEEKENLLKASTVAPMSLLGEVAHQLERRIISHVFKEVPDFKEGETEEGDPDIPKTDSTEKLSDHGDQRHRFYGYSLSNLISKIREESRNPQTQQQDSAREKHLLNRYYCLVAELREKHGYKVDQHARLGQDLVRLHGIFYQPPDVATVCRLGLNDFRSVRNHVIKLTNPKLLPDLLILVNCLKTLGEVEDKPVLSF